MSSKEFLIVLRRAIKRVKGFVCKKGMLIKDGEVKEGGEVK